MRIDDPYFQENGVAEIVISFEIPLLEKKDKKLTLIYKYSFNLSLSSERMEFVKFTVKEFRLVLGICFPFDPVCLDLDISNFS